MSEDRCHCSSLEEVPQWSRKVMPAGSLRNASDGGNKWQERIVLGSGSGSRSSGDSGGNSRDSSSWSGGGDKQQHPSISTFSMATDTPSLGATTFTS